MTNECVVDWRSWLMNNRRAAILATVLPFLLLGLLEWLPGKFVPPLLYFVAAGVWALYVTPRVLGLPNGRKPFREFCLDIRLLPVQPLGRNILLGVMVATLTVSAMLLATVLTGHFVLDWQFLPLHRWVKALPRGVWEEVFFRGIALAILLRLFTRRTAILIMTALFAVVHLNVMKLDVAEIVDIVSIFFIGLLFVYLVLKTGSLLPAMVFHYLHDVFVLLVQNAPGAEEPRTSIVFYGFLWMALLLGAGLTKVVVEHTPDGNPQPTEL